MSISIPDIDTLKQLCSKLTTSDGSLLSKNFIDFMFLQRIGNKSMLRDETKHSIIDMMGIIDSRGEKHMQDLIEKYNGMELHDIIRMSSQFSKARKEDFLRTTTDLKERATLSSIVQCPKCHSNDVETRTIQRRAGDESSTDDNLCRKCGFKFSFT